MPRTRGEDSTRSARPRRRYHSPVRQQQSAETRERIVSAGAELVHGLPAWDWKNLTARAVGERAGVSERTVQRYFPTERALRDAVLRRLVEESGIDLEAMELADFSHVAAQLFRYLASFSVVPAPMEDPSFASVDRMRRDALVDTVKRATPGWSDRQRDAAAAMLDMLWNPPAYERLTQVWGFDPERATAAITWVIGLIEGAVRRGDLPDSLR